MVTIKQYKVSSVFVVSTPSPSVIPGFVPDSWPVLMSRTCTGLAAVRTAARRGSRTGWCWRGCCWPTPAGTRPWATAKDSTSWPRSSWKLLKETRAMHWRYAHTHTHTHSLRGRFVICLLISGDDLPDRQGVTWELFCQQPSSVIR